MRFLLFPFSLFYLLVTNCRNFFYNKGWLKSYGFNIPVISIGNLTMGGTGKTPHTAYFIELLKKEYKVAVLSRGYGRKTKGFILANENTTEREIGDEPMLYLTRYGDEINVAVCEKRVIGINKLIKTKNPEVILLDDAYQHRKVMPSFSILLTEYNALYTKDYLFPVGNLREARVGAKRANSIIVTKCPTDISKKEKERIRTELKLKESQQLFFSMINYSNQIFSIDKTIEVSHLNQKNVFLITGIANPKPLKKYVSEISNKVEHLQFTDHYNFTQKDIKIILEKYSLMEGEKIILTTEKDYMRLKSYTNILPFLYYLSINVEIDRKKEFDETFLKVAKR